ncbi:hypothetical protein F7731_18475 [Cytobacillus depressus]|uniref:Uncharacterized protein n=1 Tax=Cytobacillus depressus TaxID=1602942 RepID=A0A6L3V1H5_9BACI|nr:hypothetical protein F7731_18475 [Cytobacillus depressus]
MTADGAISHITFSVGNILEGKLKENGASLSTDIPMEILDGIKICFFTGLSGECIELLQLPS